ncbi:uncharacterized protein WM277_005615 isoform 5-T10 [Molossus nigricans]
MVKKEKKSENAVLHSSLDDVIPRELSLLPCLPPLKSKLQERERSIFFPPLWPQHPGGRGFRNVFLHKVAFQLDVKEHVETAWGARRMSRAL